MKKFIKLLITIIFISVLSQNLNLDNIKSQDYGFSCSLNEYEVSYINDQGGFDKVACYQNLDEAKNIMYTNNDYVIRSQGSYSLTKIIYMNKGLVYSYPGHIGEATAYIYQFPTNSSGITSYVSSKYEMLYHETSFITKDTNRYGIKGGYGRVKVTLNGYVGYADLEAVDLVPSKFIDNNLPIYLGGENTYNKNEKAYLTKVYPNYYSVEQNGNYKDLKFTYYYPTSNIEPKVYSIYPCPAPNFMEQDKKYYSQDGINFYSDYLLTNFVGTNYNYYQFLSARSKTSITSDIFDSYLTSVKGNDTNSIIKNKGKVFIDSQNRYGVNALLFYSLACHESAYGTSYYAVNRNNLFGWNAFDSNPGAASTFSSVEQAIYEQMGINLRKYLDYNNSLTNGVSIGNKGTGFNLKYASDPYWATKISSIMYRIDKYSKNYDGTLTDFNKEKLAIVEMFNAPIKKEANDNSQTLFNLVQKTQYQNNYSVLILEEVDSYFKIQLSNPISDQGLITSETKGLVDYDFDKSIAYINKSYVKTLNLETKSVVDELENNFQGEVLTAIDSIKFDKNTLCIKGYGILKNVHMDQNTKYSLELYNVVDNTSLTFDTIAIQSDLKSLNDGYNYDYSMFIAEIDLNTINIGDYFIKLNIENKDIKASQYIREANMLSNSITHKIDNTLYQIFHDSTNGYRLYLNKFNTSLDFSKNNKPLVRNTLSIIETASIDDQNKLTINFSAFMHGTNSNNQNSNKYKMFIEDVNNNVQEFEIEYDTCVLDFTSLLNNQFNYLNVCGKASIDLSKLNPGEYKLYLSIENSGYYELLELQCPNKYFSVSNKNYNLKSDLVRDRAKLYITNN